MSIKLNGSAFGLMAKKGKIKLMTPLFFYLITRHPMDGTHDIDLIGSLKTAL